MKLAFALLFALMTSNSFAVLTKTKILQISVNISHKSYGEVYMFNNDQGDIDHFEWRLIHSDGHTTSDTFGVEDLRKGTVFKKGIPKKYITLSAPNFSQIYGGKISMRYPENIILGRYNTEEFEVTRNQGARNNEVKWPFNHRTQTNFRHVNVVVNKFLGAPIGADKVQFLSK